MIPYEDISVRDARMYWDGCPVFKYDPEEQTVRCFTMNIPSDRDENDEPIDDDELFDEYQICLDPMHEGYIEYVSGRRLFKDPNYVFHRFLIEYVPVLSGGVATGIVRLCAEPTGRHAQKGMSLSDVTYLPLLEVENARAIAKTYAGMGLEGVLLAHHAPVLEGRFILQRGIAHVLQLGTPPSMRRVVTAEQASANAHRIVEELFTTGNVVAVPDFSVCVIKHRSRERVAYVLYRGNMIGTLYYNGDCVSFTGELTRGKGDALRDAEKAGKTAVVSRLLTNNINWT
jgi:hypothetical protein